MAPQKGKQGTKGAKQIVQENKETLKFYKIMGAASAGFYTLVTLIFFEFSTSICVLSFIAFAALFGAWQFMAFMAKSQIAENGDIIDSGTSLNIEGGIAEHVKDLIILGSATLILSLISNYFWYLLLFIPIRAFYLLWGTVIKPWMASRQEAAQQPEVDDKKQKKLDRRMKRMQNQR
ncbi:TMEM208 family protein [Megaselia abdita]